MYKLLPVLIENMGAAYPELDAQKELIAKVIKEEEDSFLRTLETGIRLLEKTMADAKAAGKNEISGKDAFTLYDTLDVYKRQAQTARPRPDGTAEQADRHGTCPRFGNAWRSQTASEDFRRNPGARVFRTQSGRNRKVTE